MVNIKEGVRSTRHTDTPVVDTLPSEAAPGSQAQWKLAPLPLLGCLHSPRPLQSMGHKAGAVPLLVALAAAELVQRILWQQVGT